MSLLNQVLHDLDERASPSMPQQLKLAPDAPVAPARHADDFELPPRRDWTRILVWSGVAVASGLAVWSYLQTVGDDRRNAPGVVSQVVAIPAPASLVQHEAVEAKRPEAPELPVGKALDGVGEHQGQRKIGALPLPKLADDGLPTGAESAGNPVATQDTFASPLPDYIRLRNTAPEPPAVALSVPITAGRNIGADVSPPASAVVKTEAGRPGADDDLARAAIERGDLAESELLLTRHLARYPRDIEARELLIGLMLRGERHAEALPQIDKVLAQSPERWSLYLVKARLLLGQGQPADARVLLQAVPAGVTQRAAALQMLGALEQQAGRYAESQSVYRELVTLTPLSGAAWAGLAISLDGAGEAEAATAFRRALKIGGLPEPASSYARARLLELGAADE